MSKGENFRGFNIYKRSVALTNFIYKVTNIGDGQLTDREVRLIRKKSVMIPIQIASAISQGNIKIRYKNLNDAKATLTQLRTILIELNKRKKLQESWIEVEGYFVEVLKLLHGYFGWLKEQNDLDLNF